MIFPDLLPLLVNNLKEAKVLPLCFYSTMLIILLNSLLSLSFMCLFTLPHPQWVIRDLQKGIVLYWSSQPQILKKVTLSHFLLLMVSSGPSNSLVVQAGHLGITFLFFLFFISTSLVLILFSCLLPGCLL